MICIWSSWCHCNPIISCFIKIQVGLTFPVPAHPRCPRKKDVKRVSVCLEKCSILILSVLRDKSKQAARMLTKWIKQPVLVTCTQNTRLQRKRLPLRVQVLLYHFGTMHHSEAIAQNNTPLLVTDKQIIRLVITLKPLSTQTILCLYSTMKINEVTINAINNLITSKSNNQLSYCRETARHTSYFDPQNYEVEFLSHPFGGLWKRRCFMCTALEEAWSTCYRW